MLYGNKVHSLARSLIKTERKRRKICTCSEFCLVLQRFVDDIKVNAESVVRTILFLRVKET